MAETDKWHVSASRITEARYVAFPAYTITERTCVVFFCIQITARRYIQNNREEKYSIVLFKDVGGGEETTFSWYI
jgi:hypothetical protein